MEYVQGSMRYVQRVMSKGVCPVFIHWIMSKRVGCISKGVCSSEYVRRLFIGVGPSGYGVSPKGHVQRVMSNGVCP